MAVQDLPRHLGQHSGGMVICQGQLDSVVPLEPATMPGRVVVQWDKEDCADLGIIKVDLLGLGMMAVLEDSIALIRDHYNEEVDLAQLPADDPDSLRDLAKGRHGRHVSDGKPGADVVPAAPASQTFLRHCGAGRDHPPRADRRANGESVSCSAGRDAKQVTYPHPSLEPVLKRTLGVPLFQEQLLRMAMIAAGFHRRRSGRVASRHGLQALGKTHEGDRGQTARGMERNGIIARSAGADRAVDHFFRAVRISRIARRQLCFDRLCQRLSEVSLSGGFHRRAAQQPAHGFLSSGHIVKDAQRHGLKIFPIDVTKSEWECTVVGAVVGRQSSVASSVVGRWSLVVGQEHAQEDGRKMATKMTAIS